MMEEEATESRKKVKKRGRKRKNKRVEEVVAAPPPLPRRTRSQVALDWMTKEAMILVNEIAAVEGNSLKLLSSHQKWKIIVQNCSVLDVKRTLNQCQSKWNLLLSDYKQIKQWDSKSSPCDSYWLLDSHNRNFSGLPLDFDPSLFKAIDDYVRSHKEHPDANPDSDPEAHSDLLQLIAKLGSKRQKRRPVSQKSQPENNLQNCCKMEQPQAIHVEEELQEENPEICSKEKPIVHIEELLVEDKSQESCRMEKSQKVDAAEKPQNSLVEEKSKHIHTRKKKVTGAEEPEKMVVERLCENGALIHDIVQGNLPERSDFGTTGFVRCQGDKLIACLGDIVNILGQFPYLVQGCD